MAKILQYIAYLGLRLIEGVLRLISLEWCGKIGGFGGRLFGWFAPQYRRLVLSNLHIAFGEEKTPEELRQLASKHFVALGRNLASSLKMATLPTDEVEQRLSIDGIEHLAPSDPPGQGKVAAIAHMGNWELLSQAPSIFQVPQSGTMFQKLANPFLNKHVIRTRSRNGLQLFDRSESIFGPLRFLREGGGLGLLFDQHAGDLGTWCPLFGRLASTSKLPALLAIKSKAILVPMTVHRDSPGHWRVVVHPAIDPAQPVPEGMDRASFLTCQLNEALETLIRLAPEEWFWVHDRWKTPEPDFLLANKTRALAAARTPAIRSTLKPFRVLVRSPNPLGDACMAIPAVRAMKNGARPDLELTVLCRSNLEPLWQRVTEVDRVIAVDRSLSPRAVGKAVRESAPYDAAIVLPNSLSSALECRFAGIPRIVGVAGHHRRRLINQLVPEPDVGGPSHHHSEFYLRIAAHCGADVGDGSRVFADSLAIVADPENPENRNTEAAQVPSPRRIGICPGAEYGNAKRWPVERYAETILTVHERSNDSGTPCEFHIFGSPNEAELAGQLANLAATAAPINRAGQTSIAELCDELAACDLVISNDTGTMHLAAALGVPTVAIFGSTEPAWTAPLGHGHTIIRRHVECSPCFLRECPRDYRCMHEIDTAKVVDAAL